MDKFKFSLIDTWSINFANHPVFLLIFLLLACVVFCIFFIPKNAFEKLQTKIIKKKFGKSYNEFIKEKKINPNELNSYIQALHLEIKQTFTFSVLMAFATFLISKELTPENILTTFSTVYIYTFVFSYKTLWKRNKCFFFIALILLMVHGFLLYKSGINEGEYWWLLSVCLTTFTIITQAIKIIFDYPNLIEQESKNPSPQPPTRSKPKRKRKKK